MALRDQDYSSGLIGCGRACGCVCHRVEGVKHIVACCNEPPFEASIQWPQMPVAPYTVGEIVNEDEMFDRESQSTGL